MEKQKNIFIVPTFGVVESTKQKNTVVHLSRKSISMGDKNQEEDTDVQMDDANVTEEQQLAAPTLSKSWAVHKKQVPIFSGGKIVHSRIGLRGGGGDSEESSSGPLDFLLLPVGGDVAVVDAAQGVSLGTLRGQDVGSTTISSGNQDDDEDDDEDNELDVDAITSYTLSHNDEVVVTCSHNNIMRQYHLSRPGQGDGTGETDDIAA